MTSFTHTLTMAWNDASNRTLTGNVSITADQEVNADISAPISGDHTFVLALTQTKLQSVYLKADHDITLTFKTSVPASTGIVALKAGVPYLWATGFDATQNPCPIAADCVTVHTNAAAVTVVNIRTLQSDT